MTLIIGNLDCEARWANATLPRAVTARLATMATLLRGLVTTPTATLLTTGPVDQAAVVDEPRLPTLRYVTAAPPLTPTAAETPAEMQAGTLAWAAVAPPLAAMLGETACDPGPVPWRLATTSRLVAESVARSANDRQHILTVRQRAAQPLPGAAVLRSPDDVASFLKAHTRAADASAGHLHAGDANATAARQAPRWVVKAQFTAAGRDRVYATGNTADDHRRIVELLRRAKVCVAEPWLPRLLDFGVLSHVAANGVVTQRPPHTLLCNAHGGFAGIDVAMPALSDAHQRVVSHSVEIAGAWLAEVGYCGPFTVDGFVYADSNGAPALAPLCEINARLSFGWVATALLARLGGTQFRVGSQPPSDATVLIRRTPQTPFAVWLA